MEDNINQLIERLTLAAESMQATVTRLQSQQEELSGKIDRIVAAVEDTSPSTASQGTFSPDTARDTTSRGTTSQGTASAVPQSASPHPGGSSPDTARHGTTSQGTASHEMLSPSTFSPDTARDTTSRGTTSQGTASAVPQSASPHPGGFSPSARKTLPATVTTLLAKSGIELTEGMQMEALDASLAPLSIEQRIAVKSQMARAGLI